MEQRIPIPSWITGLQTPIWSWLRNCYRHHRGTLEFHPFGLTPKYIRLPYVSLMGQRSVVVDEKAAVYTQGNRNTSAGAAPIVLYGRRE